PTEIRRRPGPARLLRRLGGAAHATRASSRTTFQHRPGPAIRASSDAPVPGVRSHCKPDARVGRRRHDSDLLRRQRGRAQTAAVLRSAAAGPTVGHRRQRAPSALRRSDVRPSPRRKPYAERGGGVQHRRHVVLHERHRDARDRGRGVERVFSRAERPPRARSIVCAGRPTEGFAHGDPDQPWPLDAALWRIRVSDRYHHQERRNADHDHRRAAGRQGIPAGTDAWYPREPFGEATSYTAHNWNVIARVKDGVTTEAATRDVSMVLRRLHAAVGDATWTLDGTAIPLRDQIIGSVKVLLLLILGASAVLLLIACANVANLLIARMAVRESEIAVRVAI